MASARIVIADDDSAVLQTMTWVLKEHGYDVGSASSGRDLMALLEERTPDLLLLDVMFPGPETEDADPEGEPPVQPGGGDELPAQPVDLLVDPFIQAIASGSSAQRVVARSAVNCIVTHHAAVDGIARQSRLRFQTSQDSPAGDPRIHLVRRQRILGIKHAWQ